MENKNYDDLVDPRLQSDYDIEEVATMVACAAACLRDSVLSRPRMSQVCMYVRMYGSLICLITCQFNFNISWIELIKMLKKI